MAGPTKPAVQVTGAKELRRALKRMGNDLKDLKAINAEAAAIVGLRAIELAPRQTGMLVGTIRKSATTTKGSVLAGKKAVPYAGPIHFGWPARNIEPQPFLYDALDQRKEQVARVYEQRVADLVERVGRETP